MDLVYWGINLNPVCQGASRQATAPGGSFLARLAAWRDIPCSPALQAAASTRQNHSLDREQTPRARMNTAKRFSSPVAQVFFSGSLIGGSSPAGFFHRLLTRAALFGSHDREGVVRRKGTGLVLSLPLALVTPPGNRGVRAPVHREPLASALRAFSRRRGVFHIARGPAHLARDLVGIRATAGPSSPPSQSSCARTER
jgi:hypothetical protein